MNLLQRHILPGTVADVKHPDCAIRLIDLIQNPVNIPALAEKEAPNLPAGFLSFAGKRTAQRKMAERIKAIE